MRWAFVVLLACRAPEPPLLFNRVEPEPVKPASKKYQYWKDRCYAMNARPFCIHRWTSPNTGFSYCACCPYHLPMSVCQLRF